MFEMSFFKKMNILFNSIISNKYFIFLLILFIINIILLILIRKKLILFISLVLIFGVLVFISYDKLFLFFDYFIDTLFNILYFPNFAFFTLIIFYINILIVKKHNKLTIIFYYLIMYLFIIILNIIKDNNIVLNSKISIYSNTNLLALIELTTFLFLLYLVLNSVVIISKKFHFKVKLKRIDVTPLQSKIINIDTITLNRINTSNYKKTNQDLMNLYAQSVIK